MSKHSPHACIYVMHAAAQYRPPSPRYTKCLHVSQCMHMSPLHVHAPVPVHTRVPTPCTCPTASSCAVSHAHIPPTVHMAWRQVLLRSPKLLQSCMVRKLTTSERISLLLRRKSQVAIAGGEYRDTLYRVWHSLVWCMTQCCLVHNTVVWPGALLYNLWGVWYSLVWCLIQSAVMFRVRYSIVWCRLQLVWCMTQLCNKHCIIYYTSLYHTLAYRHLVEETICQDDGRASLRIRGMSWLP